ncbi:hypothetical protein [Bacillus cereus group sp. MYBK195-1]|uniref:hypothetical protein n=1 Tax=Bacillus cereus group sp. MYBK195-1 TaxID=3450669 RepID=UPI003F7AC500|nr:hypothetical protein [Bacillus cereus]MDA2221138.1 hypothetical protein [Bacillus cereus]
MRTWLEYLDIPSFVYGIIFLFLMLVTRNILKEKPTEQLKTETGLHDWVQKKDLIYWLIIVMVCAISHYTYKYKDSGQLISHWSFGGTIVSIILAIIAIVYTFYDNFTSKSSVQQLENSAGKIKDITEKLDSSHLVNSSNKIEEISVQLEIIMNSMDTKMKGISTELSTIRGMNAQNFSDFTTKLEQLGLNLTSKNDNENKADSQDENTTELKKLLSSYAKVIIWNRTALLCISLINEKRLPFKETDIQKLSDAISKITSEKDQSQKKLHFSLMYVAFLNTFTIFNIYGLTFSADMILKLDTEIKGLLDEFSSDCKKAEKNTLIEKNIDKNPYEIAFMAVNEVYNLS